jgi:glycosyltransferase involved in cell wall biosynthesis
MVSIVIPTRNRKNHLLKLLQSIEQQTIPPAEVIVVDSSDERSYHDEILNSFRKTRLLFLDSKPSVCIQRNVGINAAANEWVLLLDDDIEIERDYIETLTGYCSHHPECGAVAGRLMQLESGSWVDQYPPPSYFSLIYKFLFQLPVWGDVLDGQFMTGNEFLSGMLEKYYRSRGNTFTNAGWPLITDWSETFKTSIYSLGANLVRRDWLVKSPYDENLDENGIGDNYGVALGFPQEKSIHVLSSVRAFHHRASENRLGSDKTYFNRILALHYFISKSPRFTRATVYWFYWSLVGNALYFFFRGRFNFFSRTIKALMLMIRSMNPYFDKNVKRSQ